MANHVFITGMGVSTSLGSTLDLNWQGLTQRGQSPQTDYVEAWGLSPQQGLNRALELSGGVVREAFAQAGCDTHEAACTFSASKPLFDGEAWLPPESINTFLRHRFGFSGESRNVVAACATGAYSIAIGASWIEQGLCDVVLAGSVEPLPHPLMKAGFQKMGVLSQEPVMRPFDERRSGFVFGEGAAAIVLESETHLRRRQARPLARLSGWAMGSDAHGRVMFNSKGARIADVIENALRRAGMAPSDIGHLNAHGTATWLNDQLETQAIRQAFGRHASKLAIAGTKSSTGHLLGAAGSVELAFTVLALQHQFAPPTRHLHLPDKDCDLDYTPQAGHALTMQHAMTISYGFGGPIGALVVSL